jgi:hypothetical protein
MAFVSHSKNAHAFDRKCLWAIVGTFLLLSLAWVIYPKIHASHGGFHQSYTSSSRDWGYEATPTSRPLKSFLVAGLVGTLGFLQLRLGGPRIRVIPKILFRLFLLLSAVVLAGASYLAIATRLWTASSPAINSANRIISVTGPISVFCLKLGVAVGVIDIFLLVSLSRMGKSGDSVLRS